MLGSLLSQLGLDIVAYERTGAQRIKRLTPFITGYQHTIDAMGGFGSASISLSMPKYDAEWWYTNGISKRIKTFCDAGTKVYQGFVNTTTINSGDFQETMGPLMDIGNRVSSVYTVVDFSKFPPVNGGQVKTTITEDLVSQSKYGIIEKIISIGTATDAAANKVQAVFLRDGSYPSKSSSLSISPGSGEYISVTLECLGLKDWLAAFVYNDFTSGMTDVGTKLATIIAADPNSYISALTTYLEANAFICPVEENGDRFAWDIIQELVALGNDTDDDRRSFGVYEDGLCYYSTIPSTIKYQHLLADPRQAITLYGTGGAIVKPWLVRPAQWIIVPDFQVNFPVNNNLYLKSDPRVKFIESVNFTAPWTVDLSGGKTDELSQLLAKITYQGGMY